MTRCVEKKRSKFYKTVKELLEKLEKELLIGTRLSAEVTARIKIIEDKTYELNEINGEILDKLNDDDTEAIEQEFPE